MPLTTKGFEYEELSRVKDLPVGDPEILTKYVGGPGQPPNTYFLIRKLPVNLREEPVGIIYLYKHNPAEGGSVWLCQDFIVGGADMRDAALELVDRSARKGLTLDDGTVLLPRIRDYFAVHPVAKRHLPVEIRNRSAQDIRNAPEARRSVVKSAFARTFLTGGMDNPVAESSDVAIVDINKEDDPALVTLRYRLKG